MKQRHRLSLLLGCVLVATLGAGAAFAGGTAAQRRALPYFLAQATPGASETTAATDDLRPADRAFLVQGVETARTVGELARLGVSQAAASSVRDLAQQLVGDYGGISRSLEALARRKAVNLPLQPTSYSEPYRNIATQSGTAFDRAFMREMTASTQRELQLCESTVANAKDADVRELAGTLLPTLRDHVNKARELEKNL